MFTNIALLLCLVLNFSFALADENPAVKATPMKMLDEDFEFGKATGNPPTPGVYPVRHCEMALLSKGYDAYRARLKLAKASKFQLLAQSLIFTGDAAGWQIAEIMKEKRAQKQPNSDEPIDVRVNVDAISNMALKTQWMYFDLKQNDVQVQGYEALGFQLLNEVPWYRLLTLRFRRVFDRFNRRHHEKLFLKDPRHPDPMEREGIAGGLNNATEYFRMTFNPKNRWRDQDAAYRGEIVTDMADAFDSKDQFFKDLKKKSVFGLTDLAWKIYRATIVRFIGKFKVPKKTARVDQMLVEQALKDVDQFEITYVPVKARLMHNRPRYGENHVLETYINLINSAEKEVLIENAYFIPNDPSFQKAVHNAVRRGVEVKILTNSIESNDTPPMAYTSRYYYKLLMDINYDPDVRAAINAGKAKPLRIFEWHGYRVGLGTLHTKCIVVDRKYGIIGSYNLDPRSMKLNDETVVLWESDVVGKQLAKTINNSDLYIVKPDAEGYNRSKADEITYDQAIEWHFPDRKRMKMILMISQQVEGQM